MKTGLINDDDDDDKWGWIVSVVWLTDERRLALFPAKTFVRDPHHRESPTCREQDLNLRRTWVQVLQNEVVQWYHYTTAPQLSLLIHGKYETDIYARNILDGAFLRK